MTDSNLFAPQGQNADEAHAAGPAIVSGVRVAWRRPTKVENGKVVAWEQGEGVVEGLDAETGMLSVRTEEAVDVRPLAEFGDLRVLG